MGNSAPLVSVVTPSLNQGDYIRETIESVLGQSYSPIEYWVIDGGSTDSTAEILNEYPDLNFVSEKDRGQSHAINKGFRRCRGEIVAWLNSDDTYLPGAVERAVKILVERPSAAFVYGEGYITGPDSEVIGRYPTESFSPKRLKETCFICQPTVFMRKSLLERAKWLREDLDYCFDYELWFRLSQETSAFFLEAYQATSRSHPETKTVRDRIPFHWEIARMWQDHLGEVPRSWVYGLAHAILEERLGLDRSDRFQNGLFVHLVALLSGFLFLKLNHRIGERDRQQIGEWLRGPVVAFVKGLKRTRR